MNQTAPGELKWEQSLTEYSDGCQYCKGHSPLATVEKPGEGRLTIKVVELDLDVKLDNYTTLTGGYCKVQSIHAVLHINYCPVCGARLREEL